MKELFVSYTYFKEGSRERQYDCQVLGLDMEDQEWFYNLNREITRYKDYDDFTILNIVFI